MWDHAWLPGGTIRILAVTISNSHLTFMSTHYVLSPLLGTRTTAIKIGPWPPKGQGAYSLATETNKEMEGVVLSHGVC